MFREENQTVEQAVLQTSVIFGSPKTRHSTVGCLVLGISIGTSNLFHRCFVVAIFLKCISQFLVRLKISRPILTTLCIDGVFTESLPYHIHSLLLQQSLYIQKEKSVHQQSSVTRILLRVDTTSLRKCRKNDLISGRGGRCMSLR
jgi:hypothetical protein